MTGSISLCCSTAKQVKDVRENKKPTWAPSAKQALRFCCCLQWKRPALGREYSWLRRKAIPELRLLHSPGLRDLPAVSVCPTQSCRSFHLAPKALSPHWTLPGKCPISQVHQNPWQRGCSNYLLHPLTFQLKTHRIAVTCPCDHATPSSPSLPLSLGTWSDIVPHSPVPLLFIHPQTAWNPDIIFPMLSSWRHDIERSIIMVC